MGECIAGAEMTMVRRVEATNPLVRQKPSLRVGRNKSLQVSTMRVLSQLTVRPNVGAAAAGDSSEVMYTVIQRLAVLSRSSVIRPFPRSPREAVLLAAPAHRASSAGVKL